MLMGPPGVWENHFHLQCTLRLPAVFQSEQQCTLRMAVKAAGPLTSYTPKVVFKLQCNCLSSVLEWQVFFSFGKRFFGGKKNSLYRCLEVLTLSSPLPLPPKENRERKFTSFHGCITQTSGGWGTKWLSVLFLRITSVLRHDYDFNCPQ